MKILCLSDLHLYFITEHKIYNKVYDQYKAYLKDLFQDKDFDCVVISGDIFESSYKGNPYSELRRLFNFISEDIPIIFCLGNHEFAYRSVKDTLNFYYRIVPEARYNIYCLDVDNSFEFKDYNFVGNVFWYDNTLMCNPNCKADKIDSDWLDASIKNFVPSIENKKCKEQIFRNLKQDKKNVLVTHCVPHIDMNSFSKIEPHSLYNQYSGCKDFLSEVADKNVVMSICGHTHKREMKIIYNIDCINVGNDYFSRNQTINYFIAEL